MIKRFGSKNVLNGLSLELDGGEFIAIVGRSGCGKSTFLRLIAGLERPDAGVVQFGRDHRQRAHHDVRVMFQEPRLLPWLTILENVAIGMGDGSNKQDRREAARAALGAVGLGGRDNDWPSILSGGQKQRVALAPRVREICGLTKHPGCLALPRIIVLCRVLLLANSSLYC